MIGTDTPGTAHVVINRSRARSSQTRSEALHVTPSAVSQQLASLGRELGFPVTERAGRRAVLTPRAQKLLEHADHVFAQIERARHDLESFDDQPHGIVTIGAFATAISSVLPAVVDMARDQAPGLTIRIRQLEPPAVFDHLDGGRLDIALAISFTGSPTTADPRYHQVSLGTDVLDVALPAGHPLAEGDSIDLTDLADGPWIAGVPGGCCAVITTAACAAAGFTPEIAHLVDDWQAVSQLVARGHGVALMPRLVQRDLPAGLTIRPVRDQSPRRHLFAAVRNGSQESPLLATLLNLLRGAMSMPKADSGKDGSTGRP